MQETAIELWFLLMAFLLLSRIDFHLKCNGINDRFYALLNANVLCGWNAKVPLALFIKTNLKMETRLIEPENVRIIWEESLFLNHTNLSLSLSLNHFVIKSKTLVKTNTVNFYHGEIYLLCIVALASFSIMNVHHFKLLFKFYFTIFRY